LLFGIAAGSLMLFAGFLAVRRRLFYIPIGSRQFWMRGHIWLGLLSVPLGMFHAGFGWGGGVETALWVLTAVVVASGVYGLALQHFLPRQLTIQSPNETFIEQFAHRREILRVECDFLVSERVGPLGLPAASLAERFAVADSLLHQTGSNEPHAVAPAKPARGNAERDVQLPLTRAADYLKQFRNWPSNLVPLEKELGVQGRAQIVEMLARNGQQLSAIVQVGLDRGRLVKTDIWKKLPEFVKKMYGNKAIESAEANQLSAGAAASVTPAEKPPKSLSEGTGVPAAPGEPVPAKPLSKIEMMRRQQGAKLQKGPVVGPAVEAAASIPAAEPDALAPAEGIAADIPATKPLSKIEIIRQQQLAKNKMASEVARASEAASAPRAEPASGTTAEGVAADVPTNKPFSKIEMIRQQQLAKSKEASPVAPAGDAVTSAPPAEPASATTTEGGAADIPATKPLSKVEMIRQQQLAKNRKTSPESK
jgi:hypothetical protein